MLCMKHSRKVLKMEPLLHFFVGKYTWLWSVHVYVAHLLCAKKNSTGADERIFFIPYLALCSISYIFNHVWNFQLVARLRGEPCAIIESLASTRLAKCAKFLQDFSANVFFHYCRLEALQEELGSRQGCQISFQDLNFINVVERKVFNDLSNRIMDCSVSEDDLMYFSGQDDSNLMDKTLFDL